MLGDVPVPGIHHPRGPSRASTVGVPRRRRQNPRWQAWNRLMPCPSPGSGGTERWHRKEQTAEGKKFAQIGECCSSFSLMPHPTTLLVAPGLRSGGSHRLLPKCRGRSRSDSQRREPRYPRAGRRAGNGLVLPSRALDPSYRRGSDAHAPCRAGFRRIAARDRHRFSTQA